MSVRFDLGGIDKQNNVGVGLLVSGGTFTLNNSMVNVNSNYASSTPCAIVSLGAQTDNGTVNLNNNIFNISKTVNSSTTNVAAGLTSRSPATINADNNVFTLINATTNGMIVGAFADLGNINLTNNVFNLEQSTMAYGLTAWGTTVSTSNTYTFTGSGTKAYTTGSNITSSGDTFNNCT